MHSTAAWTSRRRLQAPRARAASRVRPAAAWQQQQLQSSPAQHSRCTGAACAAAGSGGGAGGAAGAGKPPPGGASSRRGTAGEPPPPGRQQCSWLRTLAAALGGYVVLGLLQPWSLLQRPCHTIDTSQASVAVIIPVLNEANGIVGTLQALQQLHPTPAEIIVVDGNSTDNTVQLVRRSGLATRVLRAASRGRAAQMNAGAAAATSELLCFLHADTRPPKDLVAVMRQQLRDGRVVLGGFVPRIEVPGRVLLALSFHNFIKTYYAPLLFRPLSFLRGLRALFGDQTMFCRACDFRRVGGFDSRLRIMEDADLCVRMHEAGPTAGPMAALQQRQRQQRSQGKKQWFWNSSSSSSSSDGGAAASASSCGSGTWLAQQQLAACWRRWVAPRGRVVQVLGRVSRTSGRRLAAWGGLRATYIHVRVGTAWYFERDTDRLRQLYESLYTDAFR